MSRLTILIALVTLGSMTLLVLLGIAYSFVSSAANKGELRQDDEHRIGQDPT